MLICVSVKKTGHYFLAKGVYNDNNMDRTIMAYHHYNDYGFNAICK